MMAKDDCRLCKLLYCRCCIHAGAIGCICLPMAADALYRHHYDICWLGLLVAGISPSYPK